MAFPWTYFENFELGTRGQFDAETDTDVKLSFPHYSELARSQGLPAPYKGAYCMGVDLQLGTSDAYVQETAGFDIAQAAALFGSFKLWVDKNIVMANTDEFAILQFWSSTNTVEGGIYINFTTANGFRIGIGKDTSAASSFVKLELGKWIHVSWEFNPAAGSASTLDMQVDDVAATQLGTFTSAAITSAVFGTIAIDSGTTAGWVLFDEIKADDARIRPTKDRFTKTVLMTRSGHAFVGQGALDNISLLDGGSGDSVVSVFDTDVADTNDAGNIAVELKSTANDEIVDPAGMPALIKRGCYVSMSGTNPRAIVQIGRAVAWGSDGAVRSYGARR